MSPEIMDNKRYNSKTDIWSLGCILYEIMCLRLPFDGNSMAQLCQNIQTGNGAVINPSLQYSPSLKELVKDMLQRNSTLRPGINAILSRPVVKVRISCFLDASVKCKEFSHTVIHGMNILSAPETNQKPRIEESAIGSNNNSEKGRVSDTANDRERARRDREGQEPRRVVKKLDDNSPALHDELKKKAVERELRSIQDRREEILLLEGLERQKKQIENARKNKIVGKLQNDSILESDKERVAQHRIDVEIRRENEKALALAAQQALERRRALEARDIARREPRNEMVTPLVAVPDATERRGVLVRQNRPGSENAKQESPLVYHLLPPPPENLSHQPSQIGRSPKEGEGSAVEQRNAKARENLLRFERDRLERHAKLEKKANDRERLQHQRQNEIFVIPPAKQQEPVGAPQPLPQSPKILKIVENPKERIKERESKKVVSPVVAKRDTCADISAGQESPRGTNLPVKTSSVETAAILKKHDSFMKTRGPTALVASSAGAGARGDAPCPAKANQQQHTEQRPPNDPRVAAKDACKEVNALGDEASDFHVSPFIFSGSVVPWRDDNPEERAEGLGGASDHRIEFSVDVAVDYSELFAQMQEVLEEYPHASASRQQGLREVTSIPRGSGSDDALCYEEGDRDETFGDDDIDFDNDE